MVAGVWVHATAWLLRPHSAIILFYSAAKSPSPPTTEGDLGEVNAALKGGSLARSLARCIVGASISKLHFLLSGRICDTFGRR